MALLAPEKTSGPTVFDEDFQAEFYSIIMGMDFFKRDLLFTPEKFAPGWGLMFTFNTGIGLGKSKISDQAANDVRLINSGRNAEKSTEVQPVAYPNFTYQGWIARFHTVF